VPPTPRHSSQQRHHDDASQQQTNGQSQHTLRNEEKDYDGNDSDDCGSDCEFHKRSLVGNEQEAAGGRDN
jgi:hypothetical protein